MGTSAPAAGVDTVILAGYFDLKLTGLDTLQFTNISGLSHQVQVNGAPVGSATGAAADARTVSTPEPMRLTMQHVVLTTMDLWTWLKQTIEAKADTTVKKTGTLSLMPMGGVATPLKTWNLDDVYLTSVGLDQMGAAASPYLTATIEVLVGQCTPM